MSEMVLRLPNTYVEIDREEMEYVDGGWGVYYSHSQISSMISAMGFANRTNNVTLVAALTPVIPLAFAWVNALPIGGQIVFGFICGSAAYVASKVAYAYFAGYGVRFDLTWTGGVSVKVQ